MLNHYLTIARRHLLRRKGSTFINVFGLAVGLAACLLIGLYVQDELRYDRFHEHADRIYRVVTDITSPQGTTSKSSNNGWPIGRILAEDYPDVEAVTYLRNWWNPSFKHEGQYHYQNVIHADEHFFDVFSFPLLRGDAETALQAPYSLVLTEEIERKFFGDESALGRTLVLDDTLSFTVTGVTRVPRRSHIQFDVLVSFSSLCAMEATSAPCEQLFESGWGYVNAINYVLLRPGVDGDAFAAKMRNVPMERFGEQFDQMGYTFAQGLEPLTDIYLRSERGNGIGPKSDITYVYLLSAIATFILLLACVNFMNMATARSADRAKEVGIRKVVGSSRSALVRQFLGESFVTVLLGLVFSIALVSLALPFFNELAGKTLTMESLTGSYMAAGLTGLVLIVGLLAGLYPAFVLSSFRPIEMLRGAFTTGRRGARLRQGLVVFQFAVSIVLIVSTLVVLRQLRFMQQQDVGFAKEQIIVLDAREAPRLGVINRYQTIKQALATHPAVEAVSATYAVPGRGGWRGQWSQPEGRAEDEGVSLEYLPVDLDFVETFGLEIVAGRDFSEDFETDEEHAVIINEAAVEAAGWAAAAEAIGKGFASGGSGKPAGEVIGVVKDYHQHGLQEQIGPIMMGINPYTFGYFALRVDTDALPDLMGHLEQTWDRFFPGYGFDYFFLDDDFARQYETEQRLSRIFGTFAGLAILIGCLGLFGLAAFTAEQRTKEIGIRKVLGASVGGLVALLSKDFIKLVGLAFVVAAPVAYVLLQRWLDDFAYRIDMSVWTFLLAGLMALVIALATVGYQAIRTALTDPVESLRYE